MPAPLTGAARPGDDRTVTTGQVLVLVGVLCGVLFAGCAVVEQRRRGAPIAGSYWTVPTAILLVGALFGGGASLLDSGVAGMTLVEVEAPGTGARTPAVLTFDVPVEHPGAPHELLVDPRDDGHDVTDPVDVAVRLTDPSGRVLVDERETLGTRCQDTVTTCVWDSWSRDLTPATGGTYALTVTVLTPDVPVVHGRVGDDEKTDGHRIAGY